MPVTVRLSQKFTERFGEDIADELVNWFNQVDATYRSELKEINESNFARFDAKLEQRIAEVKAEVRSEMHALRTEFASLRAEFANHQAESRASIESLKAELIKWMFLFWLGTVGTVMAMMRFLPLT